MQDIGHSVTGHSPGLGAGFTIMVSESCRTATVVNV